MIRGGTVTVTWNDVETGRDDFNAPIYETVTETVDDVLWYPGGLADVDESNRPDGVIVAWSCHFPKTFTDSLRGAYVTIPGDEPRAVIGDPRPFMADNTPTRWHMPVELEGHDG